MRTDEFTPPAPSAVLVHVTGEVDIATAAGTLATLVGAGDGERIVVADLSGVGFIDCCGVGTLVRASTALGGRLALYEPSPAVARMLELTELRHAFVIYARRCWPSLTSPESA